MSKQESWVNVEQVAEHLGVQRHSIYRWIENKGFPSHKVGRLLRFKLSEVDEWVRQGGGAQEGQFESDERGNNE
jgi:excisionase family DNA binding protein